jgi:hypothetical protein
MKKKQRKAMKRAQTLSRIRTQEAWIVDAFGIGDLNRRERDELFCQAVKVLDKARRMPLGGA